MTSPELFGPKGAVLASDDPVTELRRVVGKLGLFVAGCYALLLVAGVAVLVQGETDIPLINLVTVLVPGSAFVPAAYYGVKLHTTSDPEQMRALWPKCAVYGVAGVVLLIATVVALDQVNKGA
jgi:hypothetical protein